MYSDEGEGNFHIDSLEELSRLCEITGGLVKALEDFRWNGKDSLRKNLDGVNEYLEQLKDPKKTKGFTSIPYLSDLVIEVKRVYEID